MKSRTMAMLCALLCAPPAFACGITSKLVPLPLQPGAEPLEAAAEELPAPTVVVTELVRGIGSSHASCDDTGLLGMLVEWPRGKHKLRDLGFEFKVVSGSTAYAIFPQEPQQAPVEGRKSDFLFLWRDGPPAQQKYIDLQVEVRAVTRENLRGAPARVLVRAAPGG